PDRPPAAPRHRLAGSRPRPNPRLSPRRQALPALRHDRPFGTVRRRHPPNRVLVPALPAGSAAMSATIEVRCEPAVSGWTCRVHVEDGRAATDHDVAVTAADLARLAP